jgi:hypothetical protein
MQFAEHLYRYKLMSQALEIFASWGPIGQAAFLLLSVVTLLGFMWMICKTITVICRGYPPSKG